MQKIIKIIILFLTTGYTKAVYAASGPLQMLQDTAQTNGPYAAATDEGSIYVILANLVTVFLALLGVIFLILIILGGYYWMTAAGDEQKYEKAKDTIYRAIIGLIITAAAYAISAFVLDKISANTLNNSNSPGPTPYNNPGTFIPGDQG